MISLKQLRHALAVAHHGNFHRAALAAKRVEMIGGVRYEDSEQEVVTFDRNDPDNPTVTLLEEVININSGSLNKEGVREVGRVFAREFEKIGFQTEWVEVPAEVNRAGHFVATRKGNKGKKLFLIGHIDTVFEKDI